MIEIWVKYPRDNRYKVSNKGRIIGLKGDVIKGWDNGNGYRKVNLAGKTLYVHRVVAETFIPVRPIDHIQVNHKDGVKDNNITINLEWVTNKKNDTHARELDLKDTSGENNGRSKYTWEDVGIIRDMYLSGLVYKDISDLYNMHPQYVRDICANRIWRIVNEVK